MALRCVEVEAINLPIDFLGAAQRLASLTEGSAASAASREEAEGEGSSFTRNESCAFLARVKLKVKLLIINEINI